MKDKIELLMDETGCERSQAELALQMCGYDLERAVQEAAHLLKDLVVIKAKLRSEEPLYGLLLAILNLKSRQLLRLRTVVSYNPAVWLAPVDGDWFEFERHLYACRLWEGSLQNLSQEVEQSLGAYFSAERSDPLFRDLRSDSRAEAAHEALGAVLARPLGRPPELSVKAEVLSLGQYRSLRREPAAPPPRGAAALESLVLRVALDGDASGSDAGQLKPGDLVYAQIIDPRDIAQYLARMFGSRSDDGLAPLMVPVESIEPSVEGGPSSLKVRVRFAAGVSGEAHVIDDVKVRVQREAVPEPWWKKWLRR